jgi:hypothetical protein
MDIQSYEQARESFEKFVPNAKQRKQIAGVLADLIRYANKVGPESWEVTVHKNKSYIKFNVGRVEVFALGYSWLFCNLRNVNDASKIQGVARIERGYCIKGEQFRFDTTAIDDAAASAGTIVGDESLIEGNSHIEYFLQKYKDIRSGIFAWIDDCVKDSAISFHTPSFSPGLVDYVSEITAQKLSYPSYYNEPGNSVSRPKRISSKKSAYLFVWNSKPTNWGDYQTSLKKIQLNSKCIISWRCNSTKVESGDRAFLIKLGKQPKGIIGSGTIVETIRDHGKVTGVKLKLDSLLDYSHALLGLDTLKSGALSQQWWTPQASGISIKPHLVNKLEKIWEEVVASSKAQSDLYSENEAAYTSKGAGFGESELNRKVEKAAIDFVSSQLTKDGWEVHSLEDKNCGYDLLCKKGGNSKHVEVKGIQGEDPSKFIITANEVRSAKNDKKWSIYVVTSALSNKKKAVHYSAQDFLDKFLLQPISFFAEAKAK